MNNKENIFNHDILRAFCGDGTIEISNEDLQFDHDEEDERTRLLVVDADADKAVTATYKALHYGTPSWADFKGVQGAMYVLLKK